MRVLKSTGYKLLDDAAVSALWQWRFRPHTIYKASIPIDFGATREGRQSGIYPGKPRALAIFAPKPDYPLEARAKHWGGTGIIVLDVDVQTGQVISARMLKSIGHQILDEAALSAFRRWRFKPGAAAPHVKIPIRYTMEGLTY